MYSTPSFHNWQLMAHLIGSVPTCSAQELCWRKYVFILISHSTTSDIVFYSSLDLEVTILFHSSWLLSDLYFEISLLPSSPLQSPDFPEAWAGPSIQAQPSKPSPPRLHWPPTSGGACGPTLFLELQALLSSSLTWQLSQDLSQVLQLDRFRTKLVTFPTNPPLFCFLLKGTTQLLNPETQE